MIFHTVLLQADKILFLCFQICFLFHIQNMEYLDFLQQGKKQTKITDSIVTKMSHTILKQKKTAQKGKPFCAVLNLYKINTKNKY